jgi:hypothetical protein
MALVATAVAFHDGLVLRARSCLVARLTAPVAVLGPGTSDGGVAGFAAAVTYDFGRIAWLCAVTSHVAHLSTVVACFVRTCWPVVEFLEAPELRGVCACCDGAVDAPRGAAK